LSESKQLLVLGIGNYIRMDDGAGLRTVEYLEQDETLKDMKISFKYLHTGGLDILDEINGYKHVIIVDAASMTDRNLNPGEYFHIEDLYKLKQNQPSGISSHGVGVLSVLKYAEVGGYELPDQIEIFGIQVKETEIFGEALTLEVEEGVKKLVHFLKNHISKLTK
jgi:hydrogenase maturation protease